MSIIHSIYHTAHWFVLREQIGVTSTCTLYTQLGSPGGHWSTRECRRALCSMLTVLSIPFNET